MGVIKSALIVNQYGSNKGNPGGRRTCFWRDQLIRNGVACDVVGFSSNPVSQLLRIIKRLINITPFRVFLPELKWVSQVNESLRVAEYDLIILCVPSYDVLKLLSLKKSNVRYLVDIRDGIYFESLYSSVEKYFLRKTLLNYEGLLKSADYLVSNVPGLSERYKAITGKGVSLIYGAQPSSSVILPNAEMGKLSMVYSGGLMRSSRGQNIDMLLKAKKNLLENKGIEIDINLIGRFNFLEKRRYRGQVKFFAEVPPDKLAKFFKENNCLLIVNTTDRDLLPSKYWAYLNTSIVIVSIGGSYSMRFASKDVAGVYHVDNVAEEIELLLENIDIYGQYDRKGFLRDLQNAESACIEKILEV